jgi:formylmethanofuran dehydrogenase subunit E
MKVKMINSKKCENCGEIIPAGLEKFVNCKILCERCFYRQKNKMNGRSPNYPKWLES